MLITSMVIHNKHFPKKEVYPFNLVPFQKTGRLDFRAPVIFFAGENGTGKSTLLEGIARRYGLTVWGGDKTHISHRNPYETKLYHFLTLEGSPDTGGVQKGFLFRAENFFNYASGIDDMSLTDPAILRYYGGLSFHQQSHGQSFLSFFGSRCRLDGLYLLDEPEAALSPQNQLALVGILLKIARGERKQFIISTHSPIILSYPGAQVFSFDHAPISEIAYEQTQSYRFYKSFMEDRGPYLEALKRVDGESREEDDGQGKL